MCLGKDMAKFEAKIVTAMLLNSGIRLRVVPGQARAFIHSLFSSPFLSPN